MDDDDDSSSSPSPSPSPVTELERVYASIGETINLTCFLYTKEVDWHFKDKNLTTTIISNGLQLQVTQQPLFVSSNNNNNNNNNNYIIDDDNFEQQQRRLRQRRRFQHDGDQGGGGGGDRQKRRHSTRQQKPRQQQKLLKYKVTSDLHFTHMLGVYVQGEQDEGSYQCIDSVSETPVKKTIVVILSE
jgi:hypothetical protein